MASSILIENLNPKTDVSNLCEEFRKFGRILSANIEIDNNLSSLCKGRISYDTCHSAYYAVKEMNEKYIFDRPVYVKHENMHTETCNNSTDSTQTECYKKIFVKNIDSNWDDYNLIGEFGRFGEIENAKVSATDGQSNGYGFVTFQKYSSAKNAVETMHDKVINGKKLVVQPFMYKGTFKSTTDSFKKVQDNPIQPNNLYIKNLPKDMDEHELRDLFKQFGEIQSAKIATNNSQQSKGYGFVCFCSKMAAAEAQKQMNSLSYRSKILDVSFYRKKCDNHTISRVKETEKDAFQFFPFDKKTLFSFSAKS